MRPPKHSVRRELLDAPHGRLGRVDMAVAVEGHEIRAAASTFRNDVPAELSRLDAVFSPLREELPLGIEDLHPPVRLVRGIEAAVPPGGEAARVVEFAVAGAALAPLLEEPPGPIVNANPIGLACGLASGEVAEVNFCSRSL